MKFDINNPFGSLNVSKAMPGQPGYSPLLDAMKPQGLLGEAAAQANGSPQTFIGPQSPPQATQPAQPTPQPSTGLPFGSGGITGSSDWSLGDAFSGAGIAMMARDNPEGAKQLAKFHSTGGHDPAGFDFKFDPATGKTLVMNRSTGQVTTQQTSDPAPSPLQHRYIPETGSMVSWDSQGNIMRQQRIAEPRAEPIPVPAMKMIQDNHDKIDTTYQTMLKNQEFIEMLMDGKMDLSGTGRLGNAWKTYLNDSDEKTRNAAMFEGHLQTLRNTILLDAKGVQTEGDAQRAMDQIIPGASGYDNRSVAALLRRANNGFFSAWERSQRNNDDLLRQYKTYDPDGVYRQRAEENRMDYNNRNTAIGGRWDAFMNPPPPVPEPPKQSFRQFVKEKDKGRQGKQEYYLPPDPHKIDLPM